MSQTGIIIQREFNARVRKKSFIITTLLMPVLMIGLMVAPALLMNYAGGETKRIAVIDESGRIAGQLQNDEELQFEPTTLPLDAARRELTDYYAVLNIGAGVFEHPSEVKLYVNSSSSIAVESALAQQIGHIIETEKLRAYNIEDLPRILDEVQTAVSIQTFRNDKSQEEETQAQSSLAATALGYVLGFILYIFLILYGSMVMQSVIEEKNSRVLEVMVCSVRPFQLMMGKILGIAAVAAVQIAIWGVLISAVSSFVLPQLMPDSAMAGVEALQQGDPQGAELAAAADFDPDLMQAVASMSDTGYIMKLFGCLLLFVLGGYLLYSAMFAAVGSAVESVQDAQQLQTPIMMPIILALIMMMAVLRDPNSPLAFWFSMIPFTSPVVMIARIPYDIPTWEIVLSLAILYGSFIGMVWAAAKIYRVGIFMYGKKPTFKELWKWMRYDA